MFHYSGTFELAKKDLVDRANKAMFKLISMFKCLKPSFITCLHLFDKIVKPILMYGADICGYKVNKFKSLYSEIKNDIFEKIHLRYLRYIIGVNKNVSKIGLYGETGRMPLCLTASIQYIKNWHRIVNLNKDNMLYKIYSSIIDLKLSSSWLKGVEQLLNQCNIKYEMACKMKCKVLAKYVLEKYQSCYKEGWYEEMFKDQSSKLRYYRKYKYSHGMENYLLYCNNFIQRQNLAKLRLSCHKLEIELGRYMPKNQRILPELRHCKKCNANVAETEIHFLIDCNFYEKEREVIEYAITKKCPKYKELNSENKFIYMMGCIEKEEIKILATFVSKCFEKRFKK